MFNIGDMVKCLPDNQLYMLLSGETGKVTGAYYIDNSEFISVLFPEYGSEQGYMLASLYRPTFPKETLLVSNTTLEAIANGVQGPQGIPGPGGNSSFEYTVTDIIGNTYYKGWSNLNDASAANWKIIRGIEISSNSFEETLANGNASLTNVWNDRTNLVYT